MKRYLIQAFNKDGTFKKTFKENELVSDINFSENINSGQGELNLTYNVSFNDISVGKSDFIKVKLYDDNFPQGKLIYTGIIEEINRYYNESRNQIEFTCRGLSSLLTRLYYYSSSYTFTKNDTASNIIINIIDYFNTKYGGSWLNTSGIVSSTGNINIEFDNILCLTAIRNITELTDSYFFIKEDGTVIFNKTPSNISLMAGGNIQSIEIVEDVSELINSVIVDYTGGTYTNTDASSISEYGLFEKYYSKTDLKDLASATLFGDEILNNNGPKQKTRIVVNNRYIIENIKPGNLVTVNNINYEIKDIRIEKTDYNVENSVLYLDEFDSIGRILNN